MDVSYTGLNPQHTPTTRHTTHNASSQQKRKAVIKFVTLFACIFFASSAFAIDIVNTESFEFTLKGYYKNLFLTSKAQATGDWYVGDINRLRTEWDAYAGKVFSTKVIWDNEIIGGDYANTGEFAAVRAVRNSPWLDMDYDLAQKNDFYYGEAIYRAYAKLDLPFMAVTAGRQRIDWGDARVLSPVDLFSPLSFYSVERDEITGSDAVAVGVPIGSSAKTGLVYTADDDFNRSRTGARVTKTLGHFDLSLLGGRMRRDVVTGLDLSGDIGDAGLRFEFTYTWAAAASNFVQAAIEGDYGFQNSLYLLFGLFLNTQAVNAFNPNLLQVVTTSQPIKTQYQYFCFNQIKYDFTSLFIGQVYTIWDVWGNSVFVNPELSYSLFSWFDLAVGAQLPVGDDQGEFAVIPNIYHTRAKFYF